MCFAVVAFSLSVRTRGISGDCVMDYRTDVCKMPRLKKQFVLQA